MDRIIVREFSAFVLGLCLVITTAKAASQYDDLIAQARAKIQAKQLDDAGKLAEEAIRTDSARWEGYALVGSILATEIHPRCCRRNRDA